jgi:hypothetical protein
LITLGSVGIVPFAKRDDGKKPIARDQDQDRHEAPETPLDEPRPPRMQDPRPQPGPEGPYVA